MKDIFTDEERTEVIKLLKEQQTFITKVIDFLVLENDIFAAVTLASMKINENDLGKIIYAAIHRSAETMREEIKEKI